MQPEQKSARTRVWWDGSEVRFIRWTDKSLVFNWGNPRDTSMHIPRGALARLQAKGVLRVEGYVPAWLEEGQQPDGPHATTTSDLSRARPTRNFLRRLLRRKGD